MTPHAHNFSLVIQASLFLWILIALAVYGVRVLLS